MTIITIYLIDSKRYKKKIIVDTQNSIMDLKIKYELHNFVFIFNGVILDNDKKIKDYEIEDGDIITANERSRGGEVGSSIKGFTDPKKIGPIRYSIITDGPDYLTVKDGINLFGNCEIEIVLHTIKKYALLLDLELLI